MSRNGPQLESLLRDHVEEYGDVSLAEFCRTYDLPTSRVHGTFGTWRALRERVGLPSRKPPGRSREDDGTIVQALRALARAEGPDVTQTRFLSVNGYSTELIRGRFGSWSNLRTAADLPPPTSDPRRRITDDDLLADLFRLWKQLGRFPRTPDLARLARYSPSTYSRRLGPRLVDLNTATLRWVHGRNVDAQHGPDHPDRETLIDTAVAAARRRRA